MWSAKIFLPTVKQIEYKYITKLGKEVRKWESLEKGENRIVAPTGLSMTVQDGSFGEEREKKVYIDNGWLTDGIQVTNSKIH